MHFFLRETSIALDALFLLQHAAADDADWEAEDRHCNRWEYDGDHLHCGDDDDDYHDGDYHGDGEDGEAADIMGWHNRHLLQDNCPRYHLHSRCSCSWQTSSS